MDGISSSAGASGGKGRTGARINIPWNGSVGWDSDFTASGTSKDSI